MVGVPQGSGTGNDLLEQLFPRDERERTGVVAFDAEQIEEIQRGRQINRGALDFDGLVQRAALLQPLKAGASSLVEYNYFPVHDQRVKGERRDGTGNLGEYRRVIVAVPGDQAGLSAFPGCNQPVPVQLELKNPPRLGKRF